MTAALLALLALLLNSHAHAHHDITGQMPDEIAKQFLEIACEVTGGECPDVPYVVSTPTRPGLWGFHYRGTDIVFITDRCRTGEADWIKCEAVIVHEMVHYVVSEQGRYADDSCANEQLAWAAYNMYVIQRGRFDLVYLNWRRGYPRCQVSKG